ncbi:hypothetical protein K7X08_026308 [Anisodus acutangulus]|uniref:Exostosin GT47 domain-containing protein n=1 Tax=Anisodus acutangulus TaxID=402998 RepID=A0A9Q1R4J8_9SOLA|nr:hypothetical protein K7X08_026308 [Anisodus acutangulus]
MSLFHEKNMLASRTSLYSTSSGESKTPFLPLETSSEEKVKSREIAFQTSSSSNNSGGVGVNKAACDTKQALLRVYMYDLPPEFHFGLLGWKGSGNELWPNVGMQGQVPSYPGGLNLQHSIEYWLTLDLLSSNTANITRPCTAIRVHNSSEADGGTIRQDLYYLLKDEKDVHFTFGSIKSNGVREAGRGMASSKFCLNIAADTPSSNHLFDAIASHCVPVIISDDIELPFEDVLDYSKFCVFVHSSDAARKGYLLNLLRGIKEDQWITKHFEYQYPSQLNDSVDMIWQAIARKLSFIQLKAHRNNRYRSSHLFIKDR